MVSFAGGALLDSVVAVESAGEGGCSDTVVGTDGVLMPGVEGVDAAAGVPVEDGWELFEPAANSMLLPVLGLTILIALLPRFVGWKLAAPALNECEGE